VESFFSRNFVSCENNLTPFLSLIGTIERNGEHIVLTLYWPAGRERGAF